MKQFMGRSETAALEWFVRAVATVTLVGAVAVPGYQLTQRGGTIEATLPLQAELLQPGVQYAAVDAPIVVEAAELPWMMRLWSEAGFALTLLAIGLGALMVSRVLGAILRGDPFDTRNPRRIAILAGCVLVGGTLAPLIQGAASTMIASHLGLSGQVGSPVPFELVPFVVAGLVFVVAGAFQRGSQLTADTEGLI